MMLLHRPGRAGHPAEFYEQVAEVYNEAVEAGSRSPSRDVAETWDVNESTARGWVRAARQRGLSIAARKPSCKHRCNAHCPEAPA